MKSRTRKGFLLFALLLVSARPSKGSLDWLKGGRPNVKTPRRGPSSSPKGASGEENKNGSRIDVDGGAVKPPPPVPPPSGGRRGSKSASKFNSKVDAILPVLAAPQSAVITFVTGWFLISFVKELRLLLSEIAESGIADVDGGRPGGVSAPGWKAGKMPCRAEEYLRQSPSPLVEGLVLRLCPMPGPEDNKHGEEEGGEKEKGKEKGAGKDRAEEMERAQRQQQVAPSFQQAYQSRNRKDKRRRWKNSNSSGPPLAPSLPPSPSEKLAATYRNLLSTFTPPELQMLSSILHYPPKSPPKIGGMVTIKKNLLSTLLPKPTKYKSQLLKPPTGLLLYGPPGNGKTLLCTYVSHYCYKNGRPFLLIRPGTFYSKFVGDTSNNVKCFFNIIQKLNLFGAVYYDMWHEPPPKATCSENVVVFVDEVDGLFRSRGAGGGSGGEGSEVYRDFKTEFMQFWDGFNGDGGIIVVGASNRPYDIDEAFMRRMPRSYQIGLPNSSTRLKILEVRIGSDWIGLDWIGLAEEGAKGAASVKMLVCIHPILLFFIFIFILVIAL